MSHIGKPDKSSIQNSPSYKMMKFITAWINRPQNTFRKLDPTPNCATSANKHLTCPYAPNFEVLQEMYIAMQFFFDKMSKVLGSARKTYSSIWSCLWMWCSSNTKSWRRLTYLPSLMRPNRSAVILSRFSHLISFGWIEFSFPSLKVPYLFHHCIVSRACSVIPSVMYSGTERFSCLRKNLPPATWWKKSGSPFALVWNMATWE